MNSLVSIIVPAYNAEKYVTRCVESMTKQTYENLEIIIIDDGSTDSTGTICDNLQKTDNRIVVIHQKNAGQCTARNKGIEQSKGEYIMFLDSDDYLHPDAIFVLLDSVIKTDSDMIRCPFLYVENSVNNCIEDTEATDVLTTYTQKAAIDIFLNKPYSSRKQFTAIVCAALYKKELFNDIRFPDGFIFEEGFVIPKVFLKCEKLAHYDRSFLYYRKNESGTMATNALTEKGLKSIDDWKEIHYLFSEVYPEFSACTCERWIRKYLKIFIQLCSADKIDLDNYYKDKIINTFNSQYNYFKSCKIDKQLLRDIKRFNKSPYEYSEQSTANSGINKIIKKIKQSR